MEQKRLRELVKQERLRRPPKLDPAQVPPTPSADLPPDFFDQSPQAPPAPADPDPPSPSAHAEPPAQGLPHPQDPPRADAHQPPDQFKRPDEIFKKKRDAPEPSPLPQSPTLAQKLLTYGKDEFELIQPESAPPDPARPAHSPHADPDWIAQFPTAQPQLLEQDFWAVATPFDSETAHQERLDLQHIKRLSDVQHRTRNSQLKPGEIPAGFFDDPDEEARTRGFVGPTQISKRQMQRSYDEFSKLIGALDKQSEDMLSTERNEELAEENLDYLHQTADTYQRLAKLRQQAAKVLDDVTYATPPPPRPPTPRPTPDESVLLESADNAANWRYRDVAWDRQPPTTSPLSAIPHSPFTQAQNQ